MICQPLSAVFVIESPSTSATDVAVPPTSPVPSLTKSTAALPPTAAAALAKAAETFGERSTLPLGSPPEPPAAQIGRKRLAGAFLIDVSRIHPDPQQPRKTRDAAKDRELADSIRRLGLIQPIAVRWDSERSTYLIIAGERRYAAAVAAGIAEVPCWVQSPEENQVLLRQIVENWQRQDLHPFQIADALATVRDANRLTQAQLSHLTGKPESEISRHLSLLKLAPEVQREARGDSTGEISRRHLLALTQLNPATQGQAYRTIKERGLTALETEQYVRDEKARVVAVPRRGAPQATVRRIKTTSALVSLRFRKSTVTDDDVRGALDEALASLGGA